MALLLSTRITKVCLAGQHRRFYLPFVVPITCFSEQEVDRFAYHVYEAR